jgi:nicotinate-nucleotide adenylyltransferase
MITKDLPQIIGIFGGSFDPIHNGHLRVVIELLETMPFSEIRILPCQTPALKPLIYASAEHRFNMLGLATQALNKTVIDERELKRDGVSYTYDSLVAIRDESGNKPLVLIIGNDAFAEFDRWYRWQDILSLAHIIIVTRPNYILPSTGNIQRLLENHLTQHVEDLCKMPAGKIMLCPIPLLAISATDIRRKITGNLSIRFLVPDSVLEYISNQKIYIK